MCGCVFTGNRYIKLSFILIIMVYTFIVTSHSQIHTIFEGIYFTTPFLHKQQKNYIWLIYGGVSVLFIYLYIHARHCGTVEGFLDFFFSLVNVWILYLWSDEVTCVARDGFIRITMKLNVNLDWEMLIIFFPPHFE